MSKLCIALLLVFIVTHLIPTQSQSLVTTLAKLKSQCCFVTLISPSTDYNLQICKICMDLITSLG